MLATDDKNSVLSEVSRSGRKARAYSAYGYSAEDASADSGLGYNGELCDSATGHYFLGKGYRVFSPVMMRFYSPDSWSPFGEGGRNAYTYVSGNPMMYSDPTGHMLNVGTIVKSTSWIRDAKAASAAKFARPASAASSEVVDTVAATSNEAAKRTVKTTNMAFNQVENVARTEPTSARAPMPPPKPTKSYITKNPKDPVSEWVNQSNPVFRDGQNLTFNNRVEVRSYDLSIPAVSAQKKLKSPRAPSPNQARIDRLTSKIKTMENQRHDYMIDNQKLEKWKIEREGLRNRR